MLYTVIKARQIKLCLTIQYLYEQMQIYIPDTYELFKQQGM